MPHLDFATIPPNTLVTITAAFVSKRVVRDGPTRYAVLRIEDEMRNTAPVLLPLASGPIIDVRVGQPIRLHNLIVYNVPATRKDSPCPHCEQSFIGTGAEQHLDDDFVNLLRTELQHKSVCFVGGPTTRCEPAPSQPTPHILIGGQVSTTCPHCGRTVVSEK